MAIREWRRSPACAARPDPALAPIDGDNNSWAFVRSGTPAQPDSAGRWRIYRTSVTPWRRVGAEGGMIRFAAVAGKAELWIDGQRIGTKTDAAVVPFAGVVPAGAEARTVVLLVEAADGAPSGILGPVTLEPRAR